jgi:hypothetical protein
VRDAALKLQDSMPKSDVNKEYYTQNMEKEVSGLRMICSDREPDGSTFFLAMSLLHGL